MILRLWAFVVLWACRAAGR